jgi:hypothetical protein
MGIVSPLCAIGCAGIGAGYAHSDMADKRLPERFLFQDRFPMVVAAAEHVLYGDYLFGVHIVADLQGGNPKPHKEHTHRINVDVF